MTPADYKSARERLGLTQEQLAELVGVSVRTIASRESGQHAVSREAAIAVRSLLDYHWKDEANACQEASAEPCPTQTDG
jgi:transcriptional regulator with XRE-family HTH domain